MPEWFQIGAQAMLLLALVAQFVALGVLVSRHRRERARFERERHNSDALVERLSEGIYRTLPGGGLLSANPALVALNGYGSEAEMLSAVSDLAGETYVDPNRGAQYRELMHRDGQVRDFVSEVYRHDTRERIWVTESAHLVHDADGPHPVYYEGSVRDITETVSRLRLEAQVRKLTATLPIGLFHFSKGADGAVTVPFLSASAERISGIPVEEQRATPHVFNDVVIAEDVAAFVQSFTASERSGAPWDHEFRIRARNGIEKWVRINAEIERTGDRIDWYGYIADISVRKRQEMEIEKLAFFDPLTRLPNRRHFMDRMQVLLAEDFGRRLALIYIDLDNFKGLNDSLGHDIGDRLLVQVAERLGGVVSGRGMVARMGGDEFVLLLEDLPSGASAATRAAIAMAHRTLAELRREFVLGELCHAGSASLGTVVFDQTGLTPDEVLKRADIAMYQAKAAGRNGVALFDPASLDSEAGRFELVADLRAALGTGELVLHFQPQVDFEGHIVGAEGLLRWNHGRQGPVAPARVVALAGQHGLGDALTRHVLDHGFATLAAWGRRPDMADLRLSLNVTAQCFMADGFSAMVGSLREHHGIDPTRVTLELTENVMSQDCRGIMRQMAEIKAMNIRLSLDDFGTGYSSLSRLKSLPFDEIKIDGSFVADIEAGDRDRALVKTILSMAATLGLKSVAENVENVRQEAFLRAFGCDVLQGHLYSEALPAEEFARLFGASAGGVGPEERRLLA